MEFADAPELLYRVRESWVKRYRPQSQSTDWGQSLAMYGLLTSLKVSEDKAVREYLETWLKFHLSERLGINYFCGSWSFGLLYPEVAVHFPELAIPLRETAQRIVDFIQHKAIRNGDGLLLHNIDLPNIYIDTVYYSSVVLTKLGQYLEEQTMPEALFQIREHLQVLQNGESPFYIHCAENLGSWRSEGSWARGNGWIAMTYAEILPTLETNSDDYEKLANDFRQFASEVVTQQTNAGLWRTILDDRSAYEETSASSMFLFALLRGRKLGMLDASFDTAINKAYRALTAFVDSEGKFLGVSEGTWPGTANYYKSLSTGEWWWGTGAYLLALSEAAQYKSE